MGREFVHFETCVLESEKIDAKEENEEILGLDGGQVEGQKIEEFVANEENEEILGLNRREWEGGGSENEEIVADKENKEIPTDRS